MGGGRGEREQIDRDIWVRNHTGGSCECVWGGGEGADRDIWVRNHTGGSCECVGGGGSRQRDLGEESHRRLM